MLRRWRAIMSPSSARGGLAGVCGHVAGNWARWLWLTMLVVHAPALVRAWWHIGCGRIDGQLEGCLWLTVAALFFALKSCGVTWLHFRTDGKTLLLIGLALVLVHADALGLRVTQGDELTAANVLFLVSLERVQELLGRAVRAFGRETVILGWPSRRVVRMGVAGRPGRRTFLPYAPRSPPVALA